MSHLGFLSEFPRLLVGDASMWISLAATSDPDRLLRALKCRTVITDIALSELERGRSKGRRTADEIAALIYIGLVETVTIEHTDEELFLSLISGSAAETLDDGEAATLAWAAGHGAVAVIDERKATIIGARRAPNVVLRTTTDLLLAPEIISELGEESVAVALHAALVETRMRVPPHRMSDVVKVLGMDRVRTCLSLPAAIRNKKSDHSEDVDAGFNLDFLNDF